MARYGVRIKNLAISDHPFWSAPNYRDADVVLLASLFQPGDAEAMPEVIARMKEEGKIVVVVGASPEFWGNSVRTRADDIILPALMHGSAKSFPELAAEANARFWEDLDNEEQREREASNLAMAELAAAHGALYLDRFDFMCEAEAARCLAVGDDLTKHFYDEHHTTMPGAAFFGRRMAETGWLDPVFEALAP